jgi:radical SAM protein with 4Fe4S-binding SPASM domain
MDNINIIRHLSLARMVNLTQLKASYYVSRLVKKAWHGGDPYALSIEPTTACNLGCPECPSGLKKFTRPTGRLNPESHAHMLKNMSKNVFYINYYFQGEPFINPDFLTLIKQAKEKRIYTATSTNAHFINEKTAEEIVHSGLDRLIISIDGLTQKTYENYRVNGSLEKVIESTKILVATKKRMNSNTPHLIVQFLAVKQNEHEIKDVFQFASNYGIDEVRIKTAQLYDYKNGNPLMPENEEYSRYKKQADGSYKLKYKTGNHCWRMWSSSVLTWDGKVVPCCFDKDAQHVLGTVEEQDFKTIWKSKRYNMFREAVLNNRNSIDICQNCSEGAKVWG